MSAGFPYVIHTAMLNVINRIVDVTQTPMLERDQGTDKALYKYDNYHCLFALLKNLFWISLAIYLGESAPWLLPLAILLIGSRQRSLVCVSPTN